RQDEGILARAITSQKTIVVVTVEEDIEQRGFLHPFLPMDRIGAGRQQEGRDVMHDAGRAGTALDRAHPLLLGERLADQHELVGNPSLWGLGRDRHRLGHREDRVGPADAPVLDELAGRRQAWQCSCKSRATCWLYVTRAPPTWRIFGRGRVMRQPTAWVSGRATCRPDSTAAIASSRSCRVAWARWTPLS